MRKVLVTSLTIASLTCASAVASAVFAQQGVDQQRKAEAESLKKAPGGSQTSLPSSAPPTTTTQATTSTQQSPMVKQMNRQEKQRIEKEGK